MGGSGQAGELLSGDRLKGVSQLQPSVYPQNGRDGRGRGGAFRIERFAGASDGASGNAAYAQRRTGQKFC